MASVIPIPARDVRPNEFYWIRIRSISSAPDRVEVGMPYYYTMGDMVDVIAYWDICGNYGIEADRVTVLGHIPRPEMF